MGRSGRPTSTTSWQAQRPARNILETAMKLSPLKLLELEPHCDIIIYSISHFKDDIEGIVRSSWHRLQQHRFPLFRSFPFEQHSPHLPFP